jgi:3,4-dihydroxy 2-butanone 4-phosphate synthase/GTP cyclohydrolase II
MLNAQRFIEKEGLGLIIFLHQEGRGNGTAAHIATLSLKTQGVAQGEAYKSVGFPPDVRRFDIAAKIIKFFGVDSVHLLSGNKEKRGCLKTWGIPIAKITPLFGNILWVREQIEANLTFRSRWH